MNASTSMLPANAITESVVVATYEVSPKEHKRYLLSLTTMITETYHNLDQFETLLDIQNDKYTLAA